MPAAASVDVNTEKFCPPTVWLVVAVSPCTCCVQVDMTEGVVVAPMYTPASARLVPENMDLGSSNAITGVCVSGKKPDEKSEVALAVAGYSMLKLRWLLVYVWFGVPAIMSAGAVVVEVVVVCGGIDVFELDQMYQPARTTMMMMMMMMPVSHFIE